MPQLRAGKTNLHTKYFNAALELQVVAALEPQYCSSSAACMSQRPNISVREMVSVLAYETRGPGLIPRVGTYFQCVFFSSLLSILMMNYFIEKWHHQKQKWLTFNFLYRIMHKTYRGWVRFGPSER